MTRTLTAATRGMLLCAVALATIAGLARADSTRLFFADRMLRSKGFEVHVVSNRPEEWVRSQVLREGATGGANLAARLKLHPASELGQAGPTQRDLLPFDPLRKAQTIIVLDSSTMSDAEQAALQRVRRELFGQASFPREEEVYWIGQNGGGPATAKKPEAKETYQVLVVAPGEALLKAVLDELWIWPGPDEDAHGKRCPNGEPNDKVLNGNGRCYAVPHHVRRVFAATNDRTVETEIREGFAQPYDVLNVAFVDPQAPEPLQQFAAATPFEIKLVALNWNGDKELTPEFARQLLPQKMIDDALAQPQDARGLSGWQQFCRALCAAAAPADNGAIYQYVTAPTTRQVIALLRQTYAAATDAPKLPDAACDLTAAHKLAVGPYFADRLLPRDRLVTQSRLEELTRQQLGASGLEVATNDLMGTLLAQVLVADSSAAFGDAALRQRVATATGADLLLVLSARELIGGHRSQMVATGRRHPAAMGAFSEEEPDEPDPDDRKGFFGPRKYPDGKKDPKFLRDHDKWQEEHDRWEDHKTRWAEARKNLRVTWEFEERRLPFAKYAGDLRLVDLTSGQTVWSVKIANEGVGNEIPGRTMIRRKTVIGDETPAGQIAPQPEQFGWDEFVLPVGRDCLEKSLVQGLLVLQTESLFPADLRDWSQAVQTAPPVTSRTYVITGGGQMITGALLTQQPLVVQTKLGARALTPEEIEALEEITLAAPGATVKLPGETITGTITSPTLTVRVGGEDRQLEWRAIQRVALEAAPVTRTFGFELQDGTKRNGAFAEATIAVNKYAQPLKIAEISSLTCTAGGAAAVTFVDGTQLSVTFKQPTVQIVWADEQQPVSVAWDTVRAIGPEFGAVAANERTQRPSAAPFMLGSAVYVPLADLMAACQEPTREVKYDGRVYSFTVGGESARFSAGESVVYVGDAARKVALPAPVVIKQGTAYFPVQSVKGLWGYETQQVQNGFRCTKGADVVVIQTVP